jgi:hypothetical protein
MGKKKQSNPVPVDLSTIHAKEEENSVQEQTQSLSDGIGAYWMFH